MKFTPKFTKHDIRTFILKKLQVVEDIVLDLLKQCGEQFVLDARSTNTYKDITRNLRGSIGYVILKDGSEIFGNFEGSNTGQKAKGIITKVRADYLEDLH